MALQVLYTKNFFFTFFPPLKSKISSIRNIFVIVTPFFYSKFRALPIVQPCLSHWEKRLFGNKNKFPYLKNKKLKSIFSFFFQLCNLVANYGHSKNHNFATLFAREKNPWLLLLLTYTFLDWKTKNKKETTDFQIIRNWNLKLIVSCLSPIFCILLLRLFHFWQEKKLWK